MLINSQPRDDLDKFSIKPFLAKSSISSNYVGIPSNGIVYLSQPLNLEWFIDYSKERTFKPISIKIDATQNNLHVALIGKKKKGFEFKSARLLVMGETFWNSVAKLPGKLN